MSTERLLKINQLISTWSKGAIFTQKYLSQIGFSHNLIKKYRKSKWIEPIGTGAYKLYGDVVEWYGGLYALQKQLELDIHAGGKTALELKGYAHYLRPGEQVCYLFGAPGEKLPKWFSDYNWGVKIVYKSTNLIPKNLRIAFSEYQHKEFKITISSPERAALEMLYYVPSDQGFDEAFKIMENLITLRPEIVQELLERCNSVKVKRLFLYMAEKHQHPWFKKLNLDRIDLGSGKRVIVESGVLDQKYKITVPEEKSF